MTRETAGRFMTFVSLEAHHLSEMMPYRNYPCCGLFEILSDWSPRAKEFATGSQKNITHKSLIKNLRQSIRCRARNYELIERKSDQRYSRQ